MESQGAYFVSQRIHWMLAPDEDGYDCGDCEMTPPSTSKRAWPERMKGVLSPCDQHGGPIPETGSN